ncbi:14338_t:CDS:2, partial [Cetraspora pellucida]
MLVENFYYRTKFIAVAEAGNFVIIITKEYEIPGNLQELLEKAINDVKKSPEILERQEIKEYFQEYYQKIDEQLKYFNDFNERALKIDDLNQIIDLEFEILSKLVTLKIEIFLLVEKLKNIDLENIDTKEIDLIVCEIDKYLPEWIDCCTKITNKFKKFYEGFSNLISKTKDSHYFFAVQEEILDKVADKISLYDMSKNISKKIDKPKGFFSSSKNNTEKIQNEIYSNFLRIIGLKLVYDLTTELEYATSKLNLLDPMFIQKISEFWQQLLDELKISETLFEILFKSFKQSELYAKEYYIDYL